MVELTRYGCPVVRTVGAERPVGQPLISAMEGAFTLPDDMLAGDEEIAGIFERSADS